MNLKDVLLQYEIDDTIAIIITNRNYGKTFYQGILKEINDEDIVIDIDTNNNKNINLNLVSFSYNTFIFATPLARYNNFDRY